MSESPSERYSSAAAAFHWSIAALILCNIPLGLVMEAQPMALKVTLVRAHASIGLVVLALTIGRIAWRLRTRPPAFPADMPLWQVRLANAVHGLLYIAMILIPISGWGIVAANPKVMATGFFVFGVIRLPGLPMVSNLSQAQQATLHAQFDAVHVWGAWILMALLVVHIGAALWHQFVDRRGGLGRMIPERPVRMVPETRADVASNAQERS